MRHSPIGIIDSGSGGLSVWKHIVMLLPHESTLYVGDHAYLPYSEKSGTAIRTRVAKLIKFLLTKHVKLIVIACNTATVAGINWYRKQFPDIPIVGVVPVVKTAAAMTKTNEICILSTKYTAQSMYQKKLIKEYATHIHVLSIGSSRLVKYIESVADRKTEIIEELQNLLNPIKESSFDILVLGCTHFPFIKKEIQSVIGPSIALLDSGPAVARQVKRILENNHLLSHGEKALHVFYTTSEVKNVQNVYNKLLKQTVVVLPAPIA
jgi:glutamate racemase